MTFSQPPAPSLPKEGTYPSPNLSPHGERLNRSPTRSDTKVSWDHQRSRLVFLSAGAERQGEKGRLGCLTAGAEIKEQNTKKMEKSLQVSEIVRKFAALDPVVPAPAYFGVSVFIEVSFIIYSVAAHRLLQRCKYREIL